MVASYMLEGTGCFIEMTLNRRIGVFISIDSFVFPKMAKGGGCSLPIPKPAILVIIIKFILNRILCCAMCHQI